LRGAEKFKVFYQAAILHTKTVHPQSLNDLNFVISDMCDAYFLKIVLEQFLALQPRK